MTRKKYSRKAHANRNRKLPVLVIVALIAVLFAAVVIGEWIRSRMPTQERANLEELYGSEDGYASVIANHQWVDEKAVWESDHAYLDYEVIRDELQGRFYWDSVEKLLLYTLPDQTITANAESEYDGVPVFLEREDGVYLSLSYVQKYANIQIDIFTSPNRLVIQTEWGEAQMAEVKEETAVRLRGGIKSEILTDLTAGESVRVLEQMDHWTEVQTNDGFLGYVLNSSLEEIQTVEETGPYEEPEYTNISVDGTVCLLWQQVLEGDGLTQMQEFLAKDTPVTTLAPTWYSITDNSGSFTAYSSAEYVQAAHQAGCQVWPVVENVNHDLDMTEVLTSTTNRTRLIQGLMVELEACGADGLNVDLEEIPEEAGAAYVQLIRELSVECRSRGLILSVDVNVPSAWTEYYNRKELGTVADYVVIMAYDEHYKGSEPGSTASLSFVQEGIEDTLELVSKEKVINGVPFYTRLWKDTAEGISSEAIGMTEAQAFVAEHQASAEWLDDVGQNYVRVDDGENTWQLWLEDTSSMEARLSMMSSYSLAGVACWKMGMQSDDIWQVFTDYMTGN